jgi:hypothetical protein
MSIDSTIRVRGITRLCHFTDSRNLAYMLAGEDAILPTADLLRAQQALFNATDTVRYDGYVGKICCSVEFPNVWYFETARNRPTVFLDWVVLLLAPSHLGSRGTLFCPCNAARSRGAHIRAGELGFEALFASPSVMGRGRNSWHLPCSPTDDQAEVLVDGPIPLSSLVGVGVKDEAQAKREFARLEQLGHNPARFTWIVAPHFFRKHELSVSIRRGVRPQENIWVPS